MSPRNSIGTCAELRQIFARLVLPTVGRTWRPNGRLGTLARCHEDRLPRWLIACSAAALACIAVANAEGSGIHRSPLSARRARLAIFPEASQVDSWED